MGRLRWLRRGEMVLSYAEREQLGYLLALLALLGRGRLGDGTRAEVADLRARLDPSPTRRVSREGVADGGGHGG